MKQTWKDPPIQPKMTGARHRVHLWANGKPSSTYACTDGSFSKASYTDVTRRLGYWLQRQFFGLEHRSREFFRVKTNAPFG